MQNRYLGDVHDYIKFALLRHLGKALNVRIGVNWYLTDPENNGDGGQRGFLDKPAEWARLDRDLFGALQPFRDPAYRTFDNFERDEILPKSTLYYKNMVGTKDGRSRWHELATSTLSEAGLIFLDQDNGFEIKPKSMAGRTHKYAMYSEAADYFERGKIVLGIQFANRAKPVDRAKAVREKLVQTSGCAVVLPVVRGRVTPNILFLALSPSDRATEVEKALGAFGTESPVLNGIKRIELIG